MTGTVSEPADGIRGFIEKRLRELENRIGGGQVQVNGVDLVKTVKRDIEACRDLLRFVSAVESGRAQSAAILKALASRWRDHPNFDKSWLHKL